MSRWNEKQSIEKEEKIKIVVDYFLNHLNDSILDISNALNIPKSSVQRYLNDILIDDIYGEEIRIKISNQLAYNKEVGKSRGGKNAIENNHTFRDEEGKFSYVVSKKNLSGKKDEYILTAAKTVEEIIINLAYKSLCENYDNLNQFAESQGIDVEEIKGAFIEVLPYIDNNGLYEEVCKKYSIIDRINEQEVIRRM